jgi:aspartyl/glutamyl-tRNA(Asn/Gln) amidotransferase C subunit
MSTHIQPQEIKNLSNLAKLNISEAEEKSLAKDLANILDYVAVLQSVDVSGVTLARKVDSLSGLRPDIVEATDQPLSALLPEQKLDDGLLETPNVFSSHESSESNDN